MQEITSLDITKIYSSPLLRAKQTAEIINQHLKVNLELNENLGKILDENIMTAFSEILESSHKMLIVSHGEIYRVLLKILNAQAVNQNAKNCGLYFFSPPREHSGQWVVHEVSNTK